MSNRIYTILMMEKLELDSKSRFPDFGDERLVGYYFDKEKAFEAVKNNCCDVWETCYNYAVIEEVEEGLYQPATHDNRWFFRYSQELDQYELIEEPDFMASFVGLSVG